MSDDVEQVWMECPYCMGTGIEDLENACSACDGEGQPTAEVDVSALLELTELDRETVERPAEVGWWVAVMAYHPEP